MTQYIYLAIFLVGLLSGAAPVRFYYEAKEDARELALANEARKQEKRNVEQVTAYQDAIISMSDWYRKHPVRVHLPTTSCPSSPGSAPPSAADIIFTVGGVKASDGSAVDRGLHGNNDSSAIPN